MKFSTVMPAHNEAGNVGPTLDAIRQRLTSEGINYEIVVVNDGSTDTTAQEVQTRCNVDSGVRLVHNTGLNGFGYAIRYGLNAMTGDAVVIVMADGSDSPDDLVQYYYILRDKAECAFGSRFLPGSKVQDYPPVKLALNRLANLFIQLLFRLPYNDITNAFKGYRTSVIQGCHPLLSAHFNGRGSQLSSPSRRLFVAIPTRWFPLAGGSVTLASPICVSKRWAVATFLLYCMPGWKNA